MPHRHAYAYTDKHTRTNPRCCCCCFLLPAAVAAVAAAALLFLCRYALALEVMATASGSTRWGQSRWASPWRQVTQEHAAACPPGIRRLLRYGSHHFALKAAACSQPDTGSEERHGGCSLKQLQHIEFITLAMIGPPRRLASTSQALQPRATSQMLKAPRRRFKHLARICKGRLGASPRPPCRTAHWQSTAGQGDGQQPFQTLSLQATSFQSKDSSAETPAMLIVPKWMSA